MTNNELNTRGIVESIDKFNENSEQICITLNGLEGSINEFNKSITKLDSLKQIDITKKKMDELKCILRHRTQNIVLNMLPVGFRIIPGKMFFTIQMKK